MDELAIKLFAKGLADSTLKAYKSAQKRYLNFCKSGAITPVPATEASLCRYVSQLKKDGLKHRTIKAYLSAIRYLHIEENGCDPFTSPLLRLQYILRGVRRTEAEGGGQKRERLPITPDILRKMKEVWDPRVSDPDIVMLWAACCLGFFGFLRSGEMTVPSDGAYDPAVHLSWGDVAVDDPLVPTVLQVNIKQSKTDPFRTGVCLVIGATATDICPVAAMLQYLLQRGSEDGPLFRFKDGRPLTRERLVVAVREALHVAGINQENYCSHSFRIGAATTAATNGIEDSVIQTLGRWKSLAYLQYVKIPREQLANYSKVLCA